MPSSVSVNMTHGSEGALVTMMAVRNRGIGRLGFWSLHPIGEEEEPSRKGTSRGDHHRNDDHPGWSHPVIALKPPDPEGRHQPMALNGQSAQMNRSGWPSCPRGRAGRGPSDWPAAEGRVAFLCPRGEPAPSWVRVPLRERNAVVAAPDAGRQSASLSNRSAAELGQHDKHQCERDELERGGRPWVRSRPHRLLEGRVWSSGGFYRREAQSSQGLHPNDSWLFRAAPCSGS